MRVVLPAFVGVLQVPTEIVSIRVFVFVKFTGHGGRGVGSAHDDGLRAGGDKVGSGEHRKAT